LVRFLDLGATPLANGFLKSNSSAPEPRFPLDLWLCTDCTLVTLGHVVPSETLFNDYVYVTGTSDTMPKHFAELARTVADRFLEGRSSPLVVEAGSNDGTLLKAFSSHVRTIGVEPATNIAHIARARGVETENAFFSLTTAERVRAQKGEAALILGNNVFAHVPDVHDFLSGVDALLAADGVFVFEVPYLFDMLEHDEFDTIYHEHLSYFSVTALTRLFEMHDMQIFDVLPQTVHGGSIRTFVQRRNGGLNPISESFPHYLAAEARRGVRALQTYEKFSGRVNQLRQTLVTLLKELRREGKRVVGYGAPAKGNTMLNFMGIGKELLDYVVDKSPMKQGLFTPGMHLPVLPVDRLTSDRPDYVLILAWNFADEIMKQQEAYLRTGGRFIVPLPHLVVTDPRSAVGSGS
jgi:SAM-dependent methyltransferase